ATPAARAPAAATHDTAQPSGKEVNVHAGDTAGAIASAHRPSGISLDQMLVAMVRANPHAFIEGNVNRLRAGSVLQLPGKEEAQATPAAQARRIIATQSQDFDAYRRRLAGAAPEAEVQAASRSASGKVQTEVAEDKPAAQSADKLTLSKGSASKQTADAKTAQAKQAEDDAARLKELSKNIEDLKNVSQGTEPAPAPAPQAAEQTPPASGAAESSPAPSAVATPAPEPAATAPQAPATAPASATTPSVPATPPAEAVKPKAPPQPATPAVAAPVPEPSLLDSLTEQPLLAGGALALVLLLLGWGGYRWKQSQRNAQGPETTFADDADHPDSFFAESGGQEVDTTSSDLTTGSTSTLYSPSQLDQIGDVDPVAEADVYLAYGKDPEAEAILKEAALQHPEQIPIVAKLAEIYAKRQDRVAFESMARKVQELARGQGTEWERVRQAGAELDGENPLYKPAAATAPRPAEPDFSAAARPAFAASTPATLDSVLPEINLDLDLDDGAATLPPAHTPSAPSTAGSAFAAAAVGAAQLALDEPGVTNEIQELTLPSALPEEPVPALHTGESLGQTLDFPIDDLALADSGPMPLTGKDVPPTQTAGLTSQPSPLEFDLGDLSLDLNQPADAAPAASAATPAPADEPQPPIPSDPLATKLALAEEFKAIGDNEGARSLIEEVLAQGSGDLKTEAQRLLDTLS
ncbi:MAG: FimV/HubP family polar landmark protein, partial [Comamonas sp.]